MNNYLKTKEIAFAICDYLLAGDREFTQEEIEKIILKFLDDNK